MSRSHAEYCSERDPYGDGLDELPPNVPPGLLGERGFRLDVVDDDGGPRGLNAGVIQEWTAETTRLAVAVSLPLFFPAAFFILWRSQQIGRREKIASSVAMAAALGYVAYRLLAG